LLPYRVVGDRGPWIIMIHGLGCDGRDWEPTASLLGTASKCVLPDLWDHGRAPPFPGKIDIARLAVDVVDLVGSELFFVAGHSLGARIALEIAATWQHRVLGLLLVDGSNVPEDPDVTRVDLEANLAAQSYEDFIDTFFGSMILGGLRGADRTSLLERARRLPKATLVDLFCAMSAWDRDRFGPCVKAVRAPALVLQATSILPPPGERRVPVAQFRASPWLNTCRTNENIETREVPECGHFVLLERPDVVAEGLHGLLKV
jgi:pimeloyl-ACP methyl ester carboxylesterase